MVRVVRARRNSGPSATDAAAARWGCGTHGAQGPTKMGLWAGGHAAEEEEEAGDDAASWCAALCDAACACDGVKCVAIPAAAAAAAAASTQPRKNSLLPDA